MARRGRAGGSPFADDERSDARERALLLFYEADTKRVPVGGDRRRPGGADRRR